MDNGLLLMLLPNREWIFITKHGIHQHFFATILGGIWLKMLKMLVQSIPYMWLGWHVFLGMWKPVVAMFKSLWLNRLKFWTCFPAHHLVPPKYVLFFSLVGWWWLSMVKIPKGRLAEARLAGGWADLQRGSAAGAKISIDLRWRFRWKNRWRW